MGETAQLTFRITVWRPWVLALTPLALLATLGVVVAVRAGIFAAASAILLGFVGVAIVLLLPIGVVVWASRWHVDPYGIGGPNTWLIYHHLAWSDIESIEPWLIPGYQYVQVHGIGRRWAFWLPLFVTDMPGLRAAVAQYAPLENPLRRYLEQHPA